MTADTFARSLAAMFRTGAGLRTSLQVLSDRHPHDEQLRRLSRRVQLGCDPHSALADPAWGDDGRALAVLVSIGQRSGADAAALLDELADEIAVRDASIGSAAAHSSGVRTSARLVAALPLLFVPFTAGSGAQLTDGPGIVLVALGVTLIAVGARWLTKLVPRPPSGPDPVGTIALALSAAFRVGASPQVVLRSLATTGPLRDELRRTVRRCRLGQNWPDALAASSDTGLASLGRCISLAHRLGLPLTDSLRAFRAERALDLQHRFESEIRRAPVRMVVPLTTCILPAFAVLGAGPFLRSLSGL